MANEEPIYGLVMPFVICKTKGGPFADNDFVAGYQCGVIDTEASTIAVGHKKAWTVPMTLLPQLDLVAMRYGCVMVTEASDEFPEWAEVEFRR